MFGTIICVCIPSRGNSSVFVLIIYPSWSPSSLIHVPAFISLSHFVASFSSSLTLWTALELINGPYYAGGKLLCAAVAFDVKDWLFLVSYNKRWRSNCTRAPDFLYGLARSILKINNASLEKGHFSWRLRLNRSQICMKTSSVQLITGCSLQSQSFLNDIPINPSCLNHFGRSVKYDISVKQEASLVACCFPLATSSGSIWIYTATQTTPLSEPFLWADRHYDFLFPTNNR